MLSNLRASSGLMTILAGKYKKIKLYCQNVRWFQKNDVTLSPRLKTITRTKIITFKKNEETTTFYNDADGDANVDAGGNPLKNLLQKYEESF